MNISGSFISMRKARPATAYFILEWVGVLLALWLSGQCAIAQDYTPPKTWVSPAITGTPIAAKNGPASLYGTYVTNKSQCPRYVKVFNKKAVDVKLGVDKPVRTFKLLPKTNTWNPEIAELSLTSGLTFACTKHAGDTDTAGSPSNECFAIAIYK